MERPLIALVAIVKNESANIVDTLASAAGVVDAIGVLDTGSTDGTQDKILAFPFDGFKMLWQEPFVDFATSRNRVLQLCAETVNPVFTLMISGDELLMEAGGLREALGRVREEGANAYFIEVRSNSGNTRFMHPRILRVGGGWHYYGEVHEGLTGPGDTALLPGLYIQHLASDPKRLLQRQLDYDIPRLTFMVTDGSRSEAERVEALFYLARAHENVAEMYDSKEAGSQWVFHKYLAMGLYRQFWERSTDKLMVAFATSQYYNAAKWSGLYTPREMFDRLSQLVEADDAFGRIPEIRFMLAANAMTITDPRNTASLKKVLFYATEAARASREIKANPVHLPSNDTIEWRALHLAAECCRLLKQNPQMHTYAQRAIDAGAPAELLSGYFTKG